MEDFGVFLKPGISPLAESDNIFSYLTAELDDTHIARLTLVMYIFFNWFIRYKGDWVIEYDAEIFFIENHMFLWKKNTIS